MKRRRFLLSFLLGLAALEAAEMKPSSPPPGLAVGTRAPGFTLPSATGESVALQDLLAQGPVALAFVRSADWCPFCRRQLQDLEKHRGEIAAAGVRLVAISYDSVATNAAAVKKLGITYPLLTDAGSKVIDAYGIRNPEAKGRAAGVPHPVLFIIDRSGTIRARLERDSYRDRPEAAEIVAAARALR